MESDISLDCSGLISEPSPTSEPSGLPTTGRPGPPPLPPKPSNPPALASATPPSPPPAEAAGNNTASGPAPALPAQAAPALPAPPAVLPVPPLVTAAAGVPLAAAKVEVDSAIRRAACAVLTSLAAIAGRVRDWVVTSGLWWALSATAHAVVLSLALLTLGAVITPTYHSTAPSFESAVNTEVGQTDIQTFDITAGAIDPGELRGDLSATSGGLGGATGASAAAGGLLGGSWSPGEGTGSASASGSVGSGAGGAAAGRRVEWI